MRRCRIPAVLICLVMVLSVLQAPALAEDGGSAGVTVYFPNWNVYEDSHNQVRNLPWDRLDCVNHAFWRVSPKEGGYAAESTDPWADTDPSNPEAHFPQYTEYAEKYPGVKILISIGGWTDSGYFSEMALTEESRGSFIHSCIETLDAWPCFSGVDIDWEYPGEAREPENENDEGCPVAGDDWTNYTLLLKELREALDGHFGAGSKILTVCASGSLYTLPSQDYASLYPYVDRINLMTYDMAGPWERKTGHHTPLYGSGSADEAVKYLMNLGVPAEKIAIGSPLYSHGWRTNGQAGAVGAAAEPMDNGDLEWRQLRLLEQEAVEEGVPGWHVGYDEKAEAAWLWNDDPASENNGVFYTYDSPRSLQAKLDYINEKKLGGLIVWQVHGDSAEAGWPMITGMHTALHP